MLWDKHLQESVYPNDRVGAMGGCVLTSVAFGAAAACNCVIVEIAVDDDG